jgi:hypothetical protein
MRDPFKTTQLHKMDSMNRNSISLSSPLVYLTYFLCSNLFSSSCVLENEYICMIMMAAGLSAGCGQDGLCQEVWSIGRKKGQDGGRGVFGFYRRTQAPH